MESDKYGQEWNDESSRGPPSSKPIPKGDPLTRVQCQPPKRNREKSIISKQTLHNKK
jgi:hypothetical protein